MISGIVESDEARIRLSVRGPRGQERGIEAVIDSGFTGWLTLPSALIRALGLQWQSVDQGILADGSECTFEVYVGQVIWDGKARRILIDEAGTEPLVGVALPSGHELNMQVRPRGRVTIKRLKSRR